LGAAPRRVGGEDDGFAQRLGVTRDEGGDLRFVLGVEDRARRIQQQPAGREAGPQRIEPCLLAQKPRIRPRSHLTSGWRRTTPLAVQGTSAGMR
jgi:hypothetical protein